MLSAHNKLPAKGKVKYELNKWMKVCVHILYAIESLWYTSLSPHIFVKFTFEVKYELNKWMKVCVHILYGTPF